MSDFSTVAENSTVTQNILIIIKINPYNQYLRDLLLWQLQIVINSFEGIYMPLAFTVVAEKVL